MIRINKSVLISLMIILFVIGGCDKGECSSDSDCTFSMCDTTASRPCVEVTRCIDHECVCDVKRNCCGNKIKDNIEDGLPGNKCTCPEDYGKCSGKGKIQVGSREVDTEYLEYHCEDNECVFGVDEEDVKEVRLLDEVETNYFMIDSVTTFDNPFEVNKDSFGFRITLKDTQDDIVLPIFLNKIVLTDGEMLFGELSLNGKVLAGIGDYVEFSVPSRFDLEELEEERRLSYQIDYEHEITVRDQRLSNGTYTYKQENVRDSYEKRFSTKIFLVKTE